MRTVYQTNKVLNLLWEIHSHVRSIEAQVEFRLVFVLFWYFPSHLLYVLRRFQRCYMHKIRRCTRNCEWIILWNRDQNKWYSKQRSKFSLHFPCVFFFFLPFDANVSKEEIQHKIRGDAFKLKNNCTFSRCNCAVLSAF